MLKEKYFEAIKMLINGQTCYNNYLFHAIFFFYFKTPIHSVLECNGRPASGIFMRHSRIPDRGTGVVLSKIIFDQGGGGY